MQNERQTGYREPSSHQVFHEYEVGQQLGLSIQTVDVVEIPPTTDHITVESIAGGGFFGKVLIPEERDYVVKTSVPGPFHYFLRSKNWDHLQFPPQHSETAARRIVLATRLISQVLPVITDNRFVAPTALGYTRLPEGYAYIIEKMNGRGPRYDVDEDEFAAFRNAQSELTSYGYELGLEHVGQIHPDNPFGMANLWWNEERNQWVWLDTIPAIPHRGVVWPGIKYDFHYEIRNHFKSDNPTFDRIHTDRFRLAITARRDSFTDAEYEQLMSDLELYDEYLVSEASIDTSDRATAYYALAKALKDKPLDVGRDVVQTALDVWQDPEVFITKGVDEARNQDYLSEEEYGRVKKFIEAINNKKDGISNAAIYRGLIAYYFITGRVTDAVSGYAGLDAGVDFMRHVANGELSADDLGPEVIQGLSAVGIWFALPPVLTYLGTKAVSAITKKDMEMALKVMKRIPVRGIGYAGLTAQATVNTGDRTAFHYQLRHILASIGGLHPAGGWGTQLEGEVWRKVGTRMEKRVQNNDR